MNAGSDSESSDESEEELLQSSDDESGSDQGLQAAAKSSSASKSGGGGGGAKSKGSKFLRGAGSDSSDDSESESESDSDESDSDDDSDDSDAGAAGGPGKQAAGGAKKTLGSKFLKSSKGGASDSSSDDDMSDSDDEDTVKVVKSAKSKRQDEMEASEKHINNAQRIGDWGTVNSEYDKLARLSAPLPGATTSLLAPVFLRVVGSLEESLAKAPGAGANEKSGKKKQMNATAARALTAVKQKVKKAVRDNDSALKEYKEDPEAYTKRWEGGPTAAVAGAASKKTQKLVATAASGEADDDDFMTVGKGGKALAFGASGEGVFKNLQIIMEARGKKNTDRTDQLKALNRLYTESCSTVYAKVRVLLILISSYFDYAAAGGSGAVGATGISSGYMPVEAWTAARERINELVDLLRTNPAYIVQEVIKEDYDDLIERMPNQNGEKDVVYVRGNLTSLVERLDDEFFKSLQAIDPHSEEYVERLKDEKHVYNSICLYSHYFETLKGKSLLEKGLDGESPLSRTLLRRLEHIYSKPDIVVAALEAALSDNTSTSLFPSKATAATSPALTRSICVYLYKNAGSRIRLRAMLCHIYHCALHDDYYTARNMFNMSNVQGDVPYSDVETQGLFNRTLVQLGLSAFRVGLIEESESTLREILQTQRVKELLLQGIPMFASSRAHGLHLTPEQEKIEKSRQLPFHMHINLELLECTYLVAAMLIEVPQLAKEDLQSSSEFNKKQVSSRIFRRMLDHSDRQTFVGPPENKRDHIIQASKALLAGDWKRTTELINTIKVWSLMPNEKAIKEMLARKIQEQALRTYLFTSARFYTNISLDHLATTLALPLSTVTPIVSRMIWEEEIAGSLDQSTAILSLQKAERTALQVHSLELLERAENMVRLLNHSRPGIGSGMDDGGDGKFGGGGSEGGHGGQRRGGNNGERRRGGFRGRGRGAGQFSGPIRAM